MGGPTFCISLVVFFSAQMAVCGGSIRCRDSWEPDMPLEAYTKFTCAKCFAQVFFNQQSLGFTYQYPYFLVSKDNASVKYLPDPKGSRVCGDVLNRKDCQTWTQCCDAAVKCCRDTQQHEQLRDLLCPATWDGVACWPPTPAGHTVRQRCPHHYMVEQVRWLQPQSHRTCTQNGTWFVHPVIHTETSNYSACFNVKPYIDIMKASVYVDWAGNSVSILGLIVAIILFVTSSLELRGSVILHLSFFVSILLAAGSAIAWAFVAYEGLTNSKNPLYFRNPVWCRVVHWCMKYFRSTTYMCMFSEGLFLHRRISRVFRENSKKRLPLYLIFSWALPLLLLLTYACCRVLLNQNKRCWVDNGPLGNNLEFIHIIPNLISLVANLFFLVTIDCTLCTKMRAKDTDTRVPVLRQAMRVSLVLVPVFGLQFLFLIYRPTNWPPYEVISNFCSSTQGLFVALLYCLTTKEIRQRLVRCCWGCESGVSRGISRRDSALSSRPSDSYIARRGSRGRPSITDPYFNMDDPLLGNHRRSSNVMWNLGNDSTAITLAKGTTPNNSRASFGRLTKEYIQRQKQEQLMSCSSDEEGDKKKVRVSIGSFFGSDESVVRDRTRLESASEKSVKFAIGVLGSLREGSVNSEKISLIDTFKDDKAGISTDVTKTFPEDCENNKPEYRENNLGKEDTNRLEPTKSSKTDLNIVCENSNISHENCDEDKESASSSVGEHSEHCSYDFVDSAMSSTHSSEITTGDSCDTVDQS